MTFNPLFNPFAGLSLSAALLGFGLSGAFGFAPSEFNNVHRYSYPTGNLIRNGSFESNPSVVEWDGWWEGPSRDPSVFSFIEAESNVTPFEGNRVLAGRYARPADSEGALKLMSDFFPLQPGRSYTLSFRYQTRNIGGGVFKPVVRQWKGISYTYNPDSQNFIGLADGDGSSLLVHADTGSAQYASSTAWLTYTMTFVAAGGSSVGNLFLVQSQIPGAEGTFYFDNVSLVEGRSAAALPSTVRKYMDGNNHVLQTVEANAPSTARVTATFYDNLGRVSKSWLPIHHNYGGGPQEYLSEATGTLDDYDHLKRFYNPSEFPSVYTGTSVFGTPPRYPDAQCAPYSQTRYEDSPLGRVVEMAGPGMQRRGAGHTTQNTYASVASLSSSSWATGSYGHFYVKETTDPDGQLTREYTDRLGRVVRKSSKLNGNWIYTDYTFDGAGNLKKIVAPPPSAGATRLTTEFEYNFANEMTRETMPTTGHTRITYDPMGRRRFEQTQAQADQGYFSYMKYDSLGRAFETGEIRNASYMAQALADSLRFPCAGCPGTLDPGSVRRIRTLSHYDDSATASLSCGGSYAPIDVQHLVETATPTSEGAVAFLALNSSNGSIAAGYDLQSVYQQARSILGSGDGKIQMIYTTGTEGILRQGEIRLEVGSSNLVLEAVNRTSSAGVAAQGLFDAFNIGLERDETLLGSAAYLRGRLVKTLACNWEVADSLGESAPREVSQEFRYDTEGNVTRSIEINGYVEDPDQRLQVSKTYYDVQNRPIEKVVCSNAFCTLDQSHLERYAYDVAGRLSVIRGKGTTTLLENQYNQLGQLSLQYLGGGSRDDTLPAQRAFAYRPEGWLDSMRVEKEGVKIFSERLYYENGAEPRFGGDISRADATLALSVPSGSRSFNAEYSYDDLGRLIEADWTGGTSFDADYAYHPDGRLSHMNENNRLDLNYFYDDKGRLDSVQGGWDIPRNFALNSGHPFIYDVSGNLVTDHSKTVDGLPLSIHYRDDGLPYLFTYKQGTDLIKTYMVYDGTGRRASKISRKAGTWNDTKSYFASGKELREVDAGPDRIYYGMAGLGRLNYPEGNVRGHREAYITDHLGTTREVYDLDSSKVSYWAHYYPYGSPTMSSDLTAGRTPTEQFTAKELDKGIDLTYFGARYYDQILGVWTSPDKAREFQGPYAYNPNPIANVDVDGNVSFNMTVSVRGGAFLTGGTSRTLSFNMNRLAQKVAETSQSPTVKSAAKLVASSLDRTDAFFGGDGKNSQRPFATVTNNLLVGAGVAGGVEADVSLGLQVGDDGDRSYSIVGNVFALGGVSLMGGKNETASGGHAGWSVDLGVGVGGMVNAGVEASVPQKTTVIPIGAKSP